MQKTERPINTKLQEKMKKKIQKSTKAAPVPSQNRNRGTERQNYCQLYSVMMYSTSSIKT